MKPTVFKTPFGMLSYALFTNKKQYRKFCKENGVSVNREAYNCDMCVVEHDMFCAVIAVHHKEFERNRLLSLLVHEGTHVWQAFRDLIEEKEPSAEFEAYTMQEIFLNLINEYDRQTA